MRAILRRLLADTRGAAAVETALIFTFILGPTALALIEVTNYHGRKLTVTSTVQSVSAQLLHNPGLARNTSQLAPLQTRLTQLGGTLNVTEWCACALNGENNTVTLATITCPPPGGTVPQNQCRSNQPMRFLRIDASVPYTPLIASWWGSSPAVSRSIHAQIEL
jgi:Flp pilus assembly pilin Flp